MKKIILLNLFLIIFITIYNFSLRYILYSEFYINNSNLLFGYQNKSITHFWKSSLGETLHLLFNTYIIALLIYLTLYAVVRKKYNYFNVFSNIVICQLVFIIQMFAEFIYFFNNKILIMHMTSISILSVSSLLIKFKIQIPDFLNYSFDTINFFEILFIIFLVNRLKVEYKLKTTMAFKIVAFGYIFPLTIWLLIITINSI